MFTEPEESYGVVTTGEAAGAVPKGGADGFSPNFGHYAAFTAEVLVAEGKEAVDYECFVTVAHGVEINVEVGIVEEEEGKPGIEGVDGDDEKDADYPALLDWVGVPSEGK